MTCIIRAVPPVTHTTPGLPLLCCPCVTHHRIRSLIIRAIIFHPSPHQGLVCAVISFSPLTSSGHGSFVLSLQSLITASGHHHSSCLFCRTLRHRDMGHYCSHFCHSSHVRALFTRAVNFVAHHIRTSIIRSVTSVIHHHT